MFLKIVCVVFFVCTNYSTNCIDLDKYEVNNDHVPELPEYFDWEPIPTSAFENAKFEIEKITLLSNETPENELKEEEDVVLENDKEKEDKDVVLEDDKEKEDKDVVLDEDNEEEQDDDIPEDVYFAGPVKAKGKVRVGANFGYGSCYPTFPYPWFPPYFYYPFYPPYPDFFPYLDPSISYDEEFARKYYGMASNKQNEKDEDNQRERENSRSKSNEERKNYERSKDILNFGYGMPNSGNENEASGKVFGGFVPASGNVKIFAQF